MRHSWKLKTTGDGGVGNKRRGRCGRRGGRPDNADTECACCLHENNRAMKQDVLKGPDQIHAKRHDLVGGSNVVEWV